MKNTKTKIIDALDRFEREYIKGDLLYFILVFLAFLSIIIIVISPTAKAKDTKYKYEICTTNKCNARVERLNKCNGNIKCAVKLTQDASYNYLYSELSNLKKKSTEPIKTNINDTVKFIAKFEGLKLNAYFDGYANNSNRRSIGYGTKSYKGETITKQEAIKRKISVIEPLYNSIPNCFTDNQKTAITSYMYNTGGFQMNLKSYIKQCKKKDVKYIMQVYGWNKSLIKRRKIEIKKYNYGG